MTPETFPDEEPTASQQARALELGPETVKAFIRAHPEIVADDPDLLGAIIPASYSDDGVIYDMQRFAIDRLKSQGEEVVRQRDRAMNALRVNATVSARMQNAILAILEARSFEQMISTVTERLGPIVGVDRVVLCMEESHAGMVDDFTAAEKLGVRVVPECGVDATLDQGVMSLLRADTHGPAMLFGPNGREVRSFALIRLAISPIAPPGILALGCHAPDAFDPSQGTDLLDFLARVIERQVRTWLELPSA